MLKKGRLRGNTDRSEQSPVSSASYPPSSRGSERTTPHSRRSGGSYNRSSVSAHSQQMSVTSTGSRRSLRDRGNRKVIIESDDDEESGRKAMSEDEFEGSEFEESDADVEL